MSDINNRDVLFIKHKKELYVLPKENDFRTNTEMLDKQGIYDNLFHQNKCLKVILVAKNSIKSSIKYLP